MRRHTQIFGRFFRLNFAGLGVGFVFYCFALTPSLLPRPALFEGLVAGICFALGYSIGVGLSWAIRRVISKEPPVRVKKIAWRVGLGIMAIAGLAFGIQAATWQNDVRRLVGETELADQHVLTIVIVAVVTAATLIFLARLIYRSIYLLSETVERWLPRRVSFAIGTVAVGLILMWFYNGVLFKTFVTVSNNMYRSTNERTKPGVEQPESAMRTGSEESLVDWDTLGRQGRSFVASGPSQEQLQALSGRTPKESIRIYIGLQSADDAEARARLAVEELTRTGAFDREILCVMTATGTGWIEPQTADALEYIWNGDTALTTIQYSYLPSWISFMVDQQNATEAGRALFSAIYEQWNLLPADDRPKLLVYGLSLGSYGAQAAFSGVEDMQNRTDGALFVGTPNGSEPWQFFTSNRDAGSPQWQPTYNEGKAVRFASRAEDLAKLSATWETPRVIYLQHASDPIVWWNPGLIWHEPDWLMEERGPDVSHIMQWYPFVTFFQVTVDQFFGTTVPNGHGHNYSSSIVEAWTALAAPTDWDTAKTTKLQNLINAYPTKPTAKTK